MVEGNTSKGYILGRLSCWIYSIPFKKASVFFSSPADTDFVWQLWWLLISPSLSHFSLAGLPSRDQSWFPRIPESSFHTTPGGYGGSSSNASQRREASFWRGSLHWWHASSGGRDVCSIGSQWQGTCQVRAGFWWCGEVGGLVCFYFLEESSLLLFISLSLPVELQVICDCQGCPGK